MHQWVVCLYPHVFLQSGLLKLSVLLSVLTEWVIKKTKNSMVVAAAKERERYSALIPGWPEVHPFGEVLSFWKDPVITQTQAGQLL